MVSISSISLSPSSILSLITLESPLAHPIYNNYDYAEFRLIGDDGDVTTKLLAQHAFGSFLGG